MKIIDTLISPFQIALKKSLESYIRLETADNDITLAASDGSLITYVKVDGSYCHGIATSPENQLFFQSLVNIAHSLHIEVIAELIETSAQQTQLESLFVDHFQGYHIGKPDPW